MEIILKEDVKGLGYKNDIVKVKPGYGRNFLIPKGIAIIANNSNRKMVEENVRQAAHKADKILKDAEAVAEKIKNLNLVIKTKAGESGKIFGAITPLQVAEALVAKGIEIDRKKISFASPVKELGTHIANIDIHKKIKVDISVEVVGE